MFQNISKFICDQSVKLYFLTLLLLPAFHKNSNTMLNTCKILPINIVLNTMIETLFVEGIVYSIKKPNKSEIVMFSLVYSIISRYGQQPSAILLSTMFRIMSGSTCVKYNFSSSCLLTLAWSAGVAGMLRAMCDKI